MIFIYIFVTSNRPHIVSTPRNREEPILSSRDLSHRATFVYWESLLRYVAALVLVPAGLFGDVGLITVPLGLGDLAIGLVYMFGLPKELGVSHRNLLFDFND